MSGSYQSLGKRRQKHILYISFIMSFDTRTYLLMNWSFSYFIFIFFKCLGILRNICLPHIFKESLFFFFSFFFLVPYNFCFTLGPWFIWNYCLYMASRRWILSSSVPPPVPSPVSDSIKSQPRVRTREKLADEETCREALWQLFSAGRWPLAFEQQIWFCAYPASCFFPLSVSSSAEIIYPKGPSRFQPPTFTEV